MHHFQKMLSIVTLIGLISCGTNTDWRTRGEPAAEAELTLAEAGDTRLATPLNESEITYRGANGLDYRAVVVTPAGTGPFPLFVWIPGTIDQPDTPVALRIIRTMAQQGVVAVSVGYNNAVSDKANCELLDNKAAAMFDPARTDSMISRLVTANQNIALTQGIAVAGHSQGAFVASRARTMLPDVRAAWLLGVGETPLGGLFTTCTTYENFAPLPVRAVNGELDYVYGGIAVNRREVQLVSGRGRGSKANSFFEDDGSGYHLVSAWQLKALAAGHNYYQDKNHNPNTVWDSTAEPWGRLANQAWLLKHLTRNK